MKGHHKVARLTFAYSLGPDQALYRPDPTSTAQEPPFEAPPSRGAGRCAREVCAGGAPERQQLAPELAPCREHMFYSAYRPPWGCHARSSVAVDRQCRADTKGVGAELAASGCSQNGRYSAFCCHFRLGCHKTARIGAQHVPDRPTARVVSPPCHQGPIAVVTCLPCPTTNIILISQNLARVEIANRLSKHAPTSPPPYDGGAHSSQ